LQVLPRLFIRFNIDGSIDNTFGVNGVADLGTTDISSASAVQNDRKMITTDPEMVSTIIFLVRYDSMAV
jgi:hypothetical protein